MLTACCASHTSVASIYRTCQSASRRLIGQTVLRPLPSSSVGPRTVQCAGVRAGENQELALYVVVVWVRCNSTLHPQTLIFPFSLRHRYPPPFPGLPAISWTPFNFVLGCVRCYAGARHLRLFFTARCALLVIPSLITPIAYLLKKGTCARQQT